MPCYFGYQRTHCVDNYYYEFYRRRICKDMNKRILGLLSIHFEIIDSDETHVICQVYIHTCFPIRGYITADSDFVQRLPYML